MDRYGLGFVLDEGMGGIRVQIPRFARNDTVMGLSCFTLTFDSSPIKGEGDCVGCVVLLLPRPVDTALKPV